MSMCMLLTDSISRCKIYRVSQSHYIHTTDIWQTVRQLAADTLSAVGAVQSISWENLELHNPLPISSLPPFPSVSPSQGALHPSPDQGRVSGTTVCFLSRSGQNPATIWFLVHSMPKTTIPVTNNIQGFLSDWKCDYWIKVVHVMLHQRWHMVTTVFTGCPPPATLQHTNRLSLNYITAISTMNCVNVDWYKMDEADTRQTTGKADV